MRISGSAGSRLKEVDLCGHATLASAHCLFEDGASGPIGLASRSGLLTLPMTTSECRRHYRSELVSVEGRCGRRHR
jgi:predicted PhzF superfamily epimerase YddE/YHI9